MFFDSHAHLTSELYDQVDEILARAQAAHLLGIVNICTDEDKLLKGLEVAKRYPWVYTASAVHPHDAQAEGEALLAVVTKHAQDRHLVAIGETGLDYHYTHSPQETQKHLLRLHLQLASETNLPVIIHCREAFQDLFQILDQEYKDKPGVLHCFTGSNVDADQVLARGWYLSLSGIVTFKKSVELREVARRVPLDRLLIETDCPYLAPQSKRGKTNEPSYLPEIAAVIAAVKGISVAELGQITANNARRLFRCC